MNETSGKDTSVFLWLLQERTVIFHVYCALAIRNMDVPIIFWFCLQGTKTLLKPLPYSRDNGCLPIWARPWCFLNRCFQSILKTPSYCESYRLPHSLIIILYYNRKARALSTKAQAFIPFFKNRISDTKSDKSIRLIDRSSLLYTGWQIHNFR